MQKLTRKDLWSLEEYSERRPAFRAEVLAHKKNRQVHLGPNATLYFEDRMVVQYQIQEMLRIERIFDREAIQEELDAYNPLIPDGTNLKATFMLEYPDIEQRRQALGRLVGIEDKVWVRVGNLDRAWAIADEDLGRATDEKTSAVHFLRFELTPEMIAQARQGTPLAMGIDHEHYHHEVSSLPDNIRKALVADLG